MKRKQIKEWTREIIINREIFYRTPVELINLLEYDFIKKDRAKIRWMTKLSFYEKTYL